MKRFLLFAAVAFVVVASPSVAQTLNIDHQPVACAAAEKFPRLEARFTPADTVAMARVSALAAWPGSRAISQSVSLPAFHAMSSGAAPRAPTTVPTTWLRNHKTIKYRIGIARGTGSVAWYGDAG